jgi:hypothetical protein
MKPNQGYVIPIFLSVLLVAPATSLLAQSPRAESDAARAAAPKLPARPPRAQVTPVPAASPPISSPETKAIASELTDPNRAGLSGAVLGLRIDSTISFLGLSRCGARIKQVMIALTDNRPSAYYFEPTTRVASQGPVLITLESLSGDTLEAGSRYSVLTINPTCSGFYTQTVSWQMACAEVARFAFPNFKFDRRVVANVDSFRASPTLQLSAMKAGQGCVTIKKEIF